MQRHQKSCFASHLPKEGPIVVGHTADVQKLIGGDLEAGDGGADLVLQGGHLVTVHQLEHLKQVAAVGQLVQAGVFHVDERQHRPEGPRGGVLDCDDLFAFELAGKLCLKLFETLDFSAYSHKYCQQYGHAGNLGQIFKVLTDLNF